MTFLQVVRFFIDDAARFVSPLAVSLQWELVFLAALGIWLAPAWLGSEVAAASSRVRTPGKSSRCFDCPMRDLARRDSFIASGNLSST